MFKQFLMSNSRIKIYEGSCLQNVTDKWEHYLVSFEMGEALKSSCWF